VVDERTYEGTVRVKLGPINLSYKGKAVMDEMDDSSHTAKLTASGKDVRGGGTARAGVLMQLEKISDTTTGMAVTADVQLTGKVASFGRGAIQDVSTKLFGQFAQCLRETLEEEGRTAAATPSGGGASAPAGTATGQGAAAAAPAPGSTVPSAGTAASAGIAGATAQVPGAGGQTTADADDAAVTEAEAQVAGATAGEAGAGAPLPTAGSGAAQVPPRPAAAPRASKPIQGGGLVLTAIVGLLKALGAALVAFVRRLFGRS
jgi:carbon monoxide dehydrogenase subunit G